MTCNVLLSGVGGEGVLFTSVIVARAANIEGQEVRGTQLHGLAQRGGAIPIHIRFGKTVNSPIIPRAQADLILALEPLEAARFCYFASKERTNFLVDTFPVKPVYANLLGQEYPSMEKIKAMIEPFARKYYFLDVSHTCEDRLGDPVYGNIMLLGVAVSRGMLPLKKQSVVEAIKASVPKNPEPDIKAFHMGLEYRE